MFDMGWVGWGWEHSWAFRNVLMLGHAQVEALLFREYTASAENRDNQVRAHASSQTPGPAITYTALNPAGGHWHSKGLAPQHHYGHPMRVGSGAARRQPLFLLIKSHLLQETRFYRS